VILTRTWIAMDACGNTTEGSQQIELVDNEAPGMICPPDVTVPIDKFEECAGDVVPGEPEVSDNCDADPDAVGVRSDGLPLDAPYPLGETSIVWTATDRCGNEATCKQIITVAASGNDCNDNGIPDECEPDCNGNGIPDDCDIADGTSQDCNGNGIPDECDIDPTDPDGDGMVSDDLNGNGVPDECEVETCLHGGQDKPRLLVMQYTGDDCSSTNHSQEPTMVGCQDFDGPGPLPQTVFMFVTNKPLPGAGQEKIWFQGDVSID
ncbi:MAG: HYR domain-containing protein, partial [Gemmatimonadales bacterium]|nr:HYR domain-containing protein [Gemmatimonadales bacterium]